MQTKIQNYKDLTIWKDSMNLATRVYTDTENYPKSEQYGLSQQMRRSAVSIPSNIAEGYERKSLKSYIHFLRVAIGSLSELETQIILSSNIKLINADKLNNYSQSILSIKKRGYSLIKTLENKK